MFNKLEKAKQRYEFLTEEIAKPEVIANNNEWKKLVKEHSGLSPVVEKYEEWRKNNEALTDSLALSDAETDEEMKALLHEEIKLLKEKKEKGQHENKKK